MELFRAGDVARGHAGSRPRFLPEAHRLLAPGRWLVVSDGAEQGAMAGTPSFAAWYRDEYPGRLPRPPRDESPITDEEAARARFGVTHRLDYSLEWPFALAEYVDFTMTQSSVTAAVGQGRESADGIRAWLGESLKSAFATGERRMLFGGYIWILERAP